MASRLLAERDEALERRQAWQMNAEACCKVIASLERELAEYGTRIQNEIAARRLAQEHGIGDRARIEELEQRVKECDEHLCHRTVGHTP